jgi:hypothetical protein
MPKTSTLIPLVLTLVLGSPAAVHAQQQWNASAGDFPEASLPTLPLSRIGIPGVDVTMQDALRSDQERASWLYESAMYRETTPSPEQNVTGVLSSRAAPPSAPLSNAVVSGRVYSRLISCTLTSVSPVRLHCRRQHRLSSDHVQSHRGHRFCERVDP